MQSWKVVFFVLPMILLGCASNEATQEPAPIVEVVQPAPEDASAKNEVRLQLERSVDQWYLYNQQQQYTTADGVASAIKDFVNKNYETVVNDAQTASPRFRKVACAALGFSARAESVPVLESALSDNFEDVLLASLLGLWHLAKAGHEASVDAVLPLIAHRDAQVRGNAAMVLARLAKPGQSQLFLPLTSATEDTNDVVRVHAVAALGALGDSGAVPFLVKGLRDSKPLVRIRSAYALGRVKDSRAVGPLIDAIDDPDIDVSKAAHKALITITGREHERSKRAWANWAASQEAGSSK